MHKPLHSILYLSSVTLLTASCHEQGRLSKVSHNSLWKGTSTAAYYSAHKRELTSRIEGPFTAQLIAMKTYALYLSVMFQKRKQYTCIMTIRYSWTPRLLLALLWPLTSAMFKTQEPVMHHYWLFYTQSNLQIIFIWAGSLRIPGYQKWSSCFVWGKGMWRELLMCEMHVMVASYATMKCRSCRAHCWYSAPCNLHLYTAIKWRSK